MALTDYLKALKGYRTFIATGSAVPLVTEGVHNFIVPYLTNVGFIVTPKAEAWLVAICMGLVGVVMRLLTTTPPGQSVPTPPENPK